MSTMHWGRSGCRWQSHQEAHGETESCLFQCRLPMEGNSTWLLHSRRIMSSLFSCLSTWRMQCWTTKVNTWFHEKKKIFKLETIQPISLDPHSNHIIFHFKRALSYAPEWTDLGQDWQIGCQRQGGSSFTIYHNKPKRATVACVWKWQTKGRAICIETMSIQFRYDIETISTIPKIPKNPKNS